jgi:hypothetical protein
MRFARGLFAVAIAVLSLEGTAQVVGRVLVSAGDVVA